MAFASSCHEKLSRAWHLGRVPYTDSRAFAMKKIKSCDATERARKTLELCALVTKSFLIIYDNLRRTKQIYHFVYITFEKETY